MKDKNYSGDYIDKENFHQAKSSPMMECTINDLIDSILSEIHNTVRHNSNLFNLIDVINPFRNASNSAEQDRIKEENDFILNKLRVMLQLLQSNNKVLAERINHLENTIG